MARQQTQPVDLVRTVARRWKTVAYAALLGALIAIVVTIFQPRVYTSQAKLFVRLGRESVTLDPSATTGQNVNLQESRENEINSVSELLQSRAVMEGVVDRLGSELVLEESGSGIIGTLMAPVAWVLSNPGGEQRDQAIKSLTDHLGCSMMKKSNIITVSYRSDDPKHAQTLLDAVVRVGKEKHLQVNRTAGSRDFFADQTKQFQDKLKQLQEQRKDLKNRSGLASFESQRDSSLRRMADLETDSIRRQASLSAVEAELAARRSLLETLPVTLVQAETAGMPNSATEGMRQQLYTLLLKEKELLAQYQKDTFFVRRIQEQLDSARKALAEEQSQIQVSKGPNEARRSVELALLNQEATKQALKAEISVLDTQINYIKDKVIGMNDVEMQLAELNMQIDLETDNFRRYASNLEQARIDVALADEKISNLNILQEPTYNSLRTSPKTKVNLILGMLLGAVGGICLAIRDEYRQKALAMPLSRNGSGDYDSTRSLSPRSSSSGYQDLIRTGEPRQPSSSTG